MSNNSTPSIVVEKWRSDPSIGLVAIINDSDEKFTLLGKSILSFLSNNGDDFNNCEGRKLAQQVISENIETEVNLYALFLIVWAITASKGLNLAESNLILKKLEELDQNNLYPETQATILATIGYCKAVDGDKIVRIKYLQEALKVKNLNDPHKLNTISGIQGALQSHGLLKDLEQLITGPIVKNNIINIDSERTISLLGNSIQLCQFSYANQLLREINSDPIKLKMFKNSGNQHDIDVIYFKFIEDPASYLFINYTTEDPSLKYYQKWITATGYLFLGDSKTALTWARKYADEHPIGMRNRNLQSFALIRAEIANKNCEAAKKLLSIKINQGYPHFFDDFFYARIALLENNTETALSYLKQLHKSCEHYDAYGRLDFELSLSCELSAKDISFFIKPTFENKNDFLSIINSNTTKQNKTSTDELIGESEVILSIKQKIIKFASSTGVILLNGETGVGKEIVAKAIHQNSDRKNKPYIPINCGSISESLLQSELFGHMAGAFTGAYKYQKGIFEAAEDGTVFLDEIGEISPLVQVALLRVLEKNEIKPIGSNSTKKINCHIVVATNKKLEVLVSNGLFREDLFYRLNQLLIYIPPLRERGDDIILLANHFLSQNRSDGKFPEMSEDLKKIIKEFDWPGNVRQLKNEIEKMRLLNSEKLFYETEDFTLAESNNKKPDAPILLPKELPSNTILKNIVKNEKTPFRRKEKIIELFKEAGALTRGEIIKLLQIAPGTATTDLNALEKEGFITRVTPSASSRTHYFKYNKKVD